MKHRCCPIDGTKCRNKVAFEIDYHRQWSLITQTSTLCKKHASEAVSELINDGDYVLVLSPHPYSEKKRKRLAKKK